MFIALFGLAHFAARLRIPTSACSGVMLLGLFAFLAPVAEAADEDAEAQEAGDALKVLDARLADMIDTVARDREERWLHL